MYRKLEDFYAAWNYESESTLKVFDRLTAESLDQRVTPDGRSLRDLAWHITKTLAEMPGHAGIKVEGPGEDAPVPATPGEIADAYRAASNSVVEAVGRDLNDEKLTDTLTMYGQEGWTYGGVLAGLIGHQAHHRGQMTVLMRQAGLTVPGVYGPSREEWAAFGMEAMP